MPSLIYKYSYHLSFFWMLLSMEMFAHGIHPHRTSSDPSIHQVRFIENLGQWNNAVRFRLPLKSGDVFFEKDQVKLVLYDIGEHAMVDESSKEPNGVSLFFQWNPSPTPPRVQGEHPYADPYHYIRGRNPEGWITNVRSYQSIRYEQVFPGVDLEWMESSGSLKYQWILHPGANPQSIGWTVSGMEALTLSNDTLRYSTALEDIFETNLYCYQETAEGKKQVPCQYAIDHPYVGFTFPEGYDTSLSLIVDPNLIFSSFSGSLADNFGYTATYDSAGNFYAGGIARAPGYPTTPGAFQTVYGGGLFAPGFSQGFDADIAITKFSSDGTQRVYSTYLGGDFNEQPHSLFVNEQQQLIIYGRTNSLDYPVTPNAFDTSLNGNIDIVVTVLDSTGSTLVGSTYIGGSGNDGVNVSQIPGAIGLLKYNYADDARGEVIADSLGFIYVAAPTQSADFPVSAFAFQDSLLGFQSAVVFKLNADVSSLAWSTYLGGSSYDAAYSIVLNRNGQIYVTGGTLSPDFPTTPNGYQPTPQGNADGFVCLLNDSGSALISGTFVGTSAYDQSFFVQLDGDEQVYVVGQTAGSFPVVNAGYSNPNSGQFIACLNPGLDSLLFSTVFGKGDGNPDISLTAFLVDQCRNIYVSGWGGATNFSVGNTFNLPITPDAFQPNTDGSDFYFIIFGRNLSRLKYATFYGGSVSNEHVDGGTSRFDKNGVVYQAVCAGCGGNSDFPTSPGVVSNTNNSIFPSANCNLGALKFSFDAITVDVNVQITPDSIGCVPFTATFFPNAVNAQDLLWDFGNGVTSTLTNPTFTFDTIGLYHITLIGVDSTSCDNLIFSDTSQVTVVVSDDSMRARFQPILIEDCDPYIVQLNNLSFNATRYEWDFGDNTSSTSFSPIKTYSNPGTYAIRLIAINDTSCNKRDTLIQNITFLPRQSTTFTASDTNGCIPLNIFFKNTSSDTLLQQFVWELDTGAVVSGNISNSYTYTQAGIYTVRLFSFWTGACNPRDTASLVITLRDDSVKARFQGIILEDCSPYIIQIVDQSQGAQSWRYTLDGNFIQSSPSPFITLSNPGTYQICQIVSDSSACHPIDSLCRDFTFLPRQQLNVFNWDSLRCIPDTLLLSINPDTAQSVTWQISDGRVFSGNPVSVPFLQADTFQIRAIVLDDNVCNPTDSLLLSLIMSNDSVKAIIDTTERIRECDSLLIDFRSLSLGATNVIWQWSPTDSSFSPQITLPFYTPDTFQIQLIATNSNACNEADTAIISVIQRPKVEALFQPDSSCAPLIFQTVNQSTNAQFYEWQWPNATSSLLQPEIQISEPGFFEVVLIASNPNTCNQTDTFTAVVGSFPITQADFSTDVFTVQLLDTVRFMNASRPATVSVNWDFGDGSQSTIQNPVHVYRQQGTYDVCLEVNNEWNCPDRICKELVVRVVKNIGVPNAFTPNKDGMNDILRVRGLGIADMLFRVFNRWGELVFESTDPKIGWDGTFRGVDQEMDVYVYTLEATFIDGTNSGLLKGNVSLIR